MGMDGKMDGNLNIASLRITNEILSLVAEIDEFKGKWHAIGRIAPKTGCGSRRFHPLIALRPEGRA